MHGMKHKTMSELATDGETSFTEELTLNQVMMEPSLTQVTKAMCHDLLAEPFSPGLEYEDFGTAIPDSLGDVSMDSFTDLTTLMPMSSFFDQTTTEEQPTPSTSTDTHTKEKDRLTLKRPFNSEDASSDLNMLCTRVGLSRPASVDHDYSAKRPRLSLDSMEETEEKSEDLFLTPTPSPSSRCTDSPSSTVPDSTMDKHRERREKNNVASRRSREIRKQKFVNMEKEADRLNTENARLEQRLAAMEALAQRMKDMLVARMGLQR